MKPLPFDFTVSQHPLLQVRLLFIYLNSWKPLKVLCPIIRLLMNKYINIEQLLGKHILQKRIPVFELYDFDIIFEGDTTHNPFTKVKVYLF